MGALCGGNSSNNKEESKKNGGIAVTSGSGQGSDNELEDNKDNKENNEDVLDDGDGQPTMAQLALKYDGATLESVRLIGALFASDPKLWPKKEDGSDYTIDDFDSAVRNDEQVKRAISLFEKVPADDRIRLLKAFYRERYDELTGKTKGDLNKVDLNNFIVSGAIDTAKARDAPKVIDEEKVNAELRPFLMSAAQVAEPVIRKQNNPFDCKVDRTQSSIGITEYVEGLLQQAIDGRKTGKATGAARAFTDIMNPETDDGIKIPLKDYYNAKCEIDKTVLTSEASSNVDKKLLALIEAGTLVGDVEMAYWPDCYQDNPTLDGTTCLPNRGGFNCLSVIGLSQVGAMGYGNGNPNIAANGTNQAIQEVIVSMRAMTVEKEEYPNDPEKYELVIKYYQIEKESNKIHDYDAFTSKNPDIRLIQNDDIFNDWVTSFGVFGVITHAYITLIPSYILVESRHEYKLKDWEAKFDEFCTKDDNANLLQLWFAPYTYDKDTDIFVYSEWSNADKGEMPDTQEDITKYGGAMRTMTDDVLWAGEQAMTATANSSVWLGAYAGTTGVATAMQVSLKQTVDKVDSLKLTCVQALDFGKTNDAKTQTMGVGFNMDNGTDFVKTVVNDYIAFLQSKAKDKATSKLVKLVTSPFALRFAKKSNGTMSIANDYNVAWIEQPTLIGTNGVDEQHAKFLDEIWQEFWWKKNEKYQSKMHWGLYFPMTDVLKENAFKNIDLDKLDGFKNQYAKFNSGQVFCNQFTQLSGLDDVFAS